MSTIDVSKVEYPESDGRPMGETDLHRDAMFRHIELLKAYYCGQQVYVTGDLLLYYEEGNPKKFIVPDAFVAKGIAPGPRRVFLTWAERKVPDVVIETTSKKTKKRDVGFKPQLYAHLRIPEYFMYDPEQDYLDPPLQGHRLRDDQYVQIEPDDDGSLISDELGLKLIVEDDELQFYRMDTGQRLLTPAERAEIEIEARHREEEARHREEEARHREEQARHREEQARRQEHKARLAAEAEVARLRAELELLKRQSK